MRKTSLVLALAAALSGCAVIHSSTTPKPDAPNAWRSSAASENADVVAQDFWQQFQDPALDALVNAALFANPEVRIAAANVEAYRARISAVSADQWPQLGLGAGAARGKGGDYPPTPTNVYSLGLSLNWEIDLWGRVQRSADAARNELLSQQEIQRGVYLSLASSVAQSYFALRLLDAQLEISQQTLEARRKSLDLFQLRFDGGVVSEVELSQVRSEYEVALATVPDLERQIAQTENALSQLLGRNPGPIERGRALADIQSPQIPVGLPSEVLQRRPDIRAAEDNLAAADARVDAARLEWFPRISLTGLLGFASTDLDQLLKRPSQVWNGAASLAQPVFDAGRINAGIDISVAQRKGVVAQYQKAVLGAFREVEDALVARKKLGEQLEAQSRQVAALRRYAELGRMRYENGYTSYLEVLDSERTLFNAELAQAGTRGQLLGVSVALYRALGGSWMDVRIENAK